MMSLQFIMGGSGSGKSTYLYHMISREAAEHRDRNYIILVPDQFTLETQKTMVEMSGKSGILNVDVLSFHRLAYRVFEEVPALRKTVLEDMGKMMLLRKVLSEQKKNLKYFKRGLYKPGFLDECKSFLCELMQYAIGEEDFDCMEEALGGEGLMAWKLQDLRLIYRTMKEKMGDTYMMAEELVSQLSSVAASIPMLQNSVICLDGFTGFTPTQYELLGELLRCCDRMLVTVTTDRTGKRDTVFTLSKDTIRRLTKLAREVGAGVEEPVDTGKGAEKVPYRLANSENICFLEKYLFSYSDVKWEGEVSDLSIRMCRKESDEAAYVARKIWELVKKQGYRYDDIAVVTGDIAAYEPYLVREMDRMGIRYFMDYKKSIGANAMAEYILSFMEMYRKNMDYESTFRFLRCGLSPLTTEETDILENYVLAQGRRGIRSYQQQWQYEVKRIDLVQVNQYRKKLMDSVEDTFRQLRGGKKTVEEFTRIFYQLMIQNQLYEKVQQQSVRFEEEGKKILAKEYRSIYRLMIELMDELVELLGTETVSFREYEELLSAGISEGLMGFVPPSGNQVMVGDVQRSRLKNIKILFFIGINDERLQSGNGSPGILSDSERERIAALGIELAPTPEQLSAREQFYLYLTLTKPSEKLFLTYAKMGGDGSSMRPAYLIHKIQKMFPNIPFEDDEEDHSLLAALGTDRGRSYLINHLAEDSFREKPGWWELAAYYQQREPELISRLLQVRESGKEKSKLSKEAAELLYGEAIYGSVSRLESFAKCPYAHYIIYGLGLREREQYNLHPMDYGNVFHKSMEHFSHCLDEQRKQWQDLTEEEAKALAVECVDFAVKDYHGEMFYQSKRVEFTISRMKRVMSSAVWGIWNQMREGEFVQQDSEQKFSAAYGLEEGKKMTLGGVIDRVDTCDTKDGRLIKIIDYKSSKHQLSLDKVYYGLQLQLMTYMQAALEREKARHPGTETLPAAMLYYEMKEPQMEWKPESEEGRKLREIGEFKCSGYVNDTPDILEKLDGHLAKDGIMQPGSSSTAIPVSVNKKDGAISQKSKVMSTEQFEKMMKHTGEKIQEFGNRIYEGEIEAAPYSMGGQCGCDYCKLKGICGMETKELSHKVREFEPMEEEKVWEVLYGRDSVDSGAEKNH